MAAKVAASVVWLTAITLDSLFGSALFSSALFSSALAATFTGLATAFGSVFLFVTGTFNFSGAGLAAARDEVFTFGAILFTAVLATVLAAVLAGALVGVFAVLAGFAAAVFFTAGFAIDLLDTVLVAAALVFFAAGVAACVCLAGFFIAFAMESIPNGCSRAPSELRLVEPTMKPGSAFARATLLDHFTSTCAGRNSLTP